MRLGILGGTFDPIHIAHLFIAEDTMAALCLDRVLFVPNRQPAHKLGAAVAPASDRMAMAMLAIEGNPRFACSDIEMQRSGPSYTADTLAALNASGPAADLTFIVGLDAVIEMASWHRPDEVLRLARLAAVGRPGYDVCDLPRHLPPAFVERIDLVPSHRLDISSTLIRERVRAGLPIRYLVPPGVADYIVAHRLYR